MGIKLVTTYTCDRCGLQKQVEGESSYSDTIDWDTNLPFGWRERATVNQSLDGILCLNCFRTFDALMSRQKEELDAFMKMKPHSQAVDYAVTLTENPNQETTATTARRTLNRL